MYARLSERNDAVKDIWAVYMSRADLNHENLFLSTLIRFI